MDNMFEEYEKRTSIHANKRNDPTLIKEEIPVATIKQPTTTQQVPLKTVTVKYFPTKKTKKKKHKPIITSKDIRSAKRGIKWAVKGYSGTAKQAYEARLKKIELRQKNKEYELKLKELKKEERARKIRQVKGIGRKIKKVGRLRSKFSRNKSIYK